MLRHKIIVSIIFWGLIFSYLTSGTVFGSETSIEISPPMVELVMDPGTAESFEVAIINHASKDPLIINIKTQLIKQERNGNYQLANNDAAVPWLTPKVQKVIIQPQGSTSLAVTVKLPRNAAGSLVAAVIYEVLPEIPKNEETNTVGGHLAYIQQFTTIVKVTANSRNNRALASLTDVAISNGAVDQRFSKYGKNALAVLGTVVNEGNTIITCKGHLLIRNIAGRIVKDVQLGGGKGVVLPGATVDLVSVFPDGLPEGSYTAYISIPYGKGRPMIAKTVFKIAKGEANAADTSISKTVRLTVEPEFLTTQLPSGSFRVFSLSLTNRDRIPIHVTGLTTGMQIDENGQFIVSETENKKWSASPWVSFENKNIILSPGEKKIVRLTIKVPKEVEDGTRYCLLAFNAESDSDNHQQNITTTTSILTPTIVTVGKNPVKNAAIQEMKVVQLNDSNFRLIGGILVNKGNTHIENVGGQVTILRKVIKSKTEDGIEIIGSDDYETLVNLPIDRSGLILPESSAPVFAIYDKKLEPGDYQADIVLNYGGASLIRNSFKFEIKQ